MESKIHEVVKDQKLRDLFYATRAWNTNSAGCAEGTNDHTIQTVNNIEYCINGEWYDKNATDNMAPTVCEEQAAATRCRYLLTLNAAGTLAAVKGTEVRSYSYGAVLTLSWDAVQKRLNSSVHGLGNFRAGDLISISGFTHPENNGIFKVHEVASDGAWLKVRENRMIDEAEGDGVTMWVESALPDLPYGECPIAWMTVTTVAGTFEVGVDDITDDAAGATIGFTNISCMPAE